MTEVVPFEMKELAAILAPLAVAPFSPASKAMLCWTPGHVGHRHRHRPGGRDGLRGGVRELTRGVRVDRQLAGLLDRRLARSGRFHGARQQARVGALRGGGFFDVGRDVLCGRAGHQVFRHRAQRVGVGDLEFDDAADRVAPEPFFDALAGRRRRGSGPTIPLVLARASVWQAPHLATNCCLPTIRLAFSAPLTEHPLAASTASARERQHRQSRPRSPTWPRAQRGRSAGDPQHWRGRRLSERPVGPCENAAAAGRRSAQASGSPSSSPRAAAITLWPPRSPRTTARGPSRPGPRACAPARAGSHSSHASSRAAIPSTAPGPSSKDSSGLIASGTPAASARLTSASPEWAALTAGPRRRPPRRPPSRRPRGRCSARPSRCRRAAARASSSCSRRPVNRTRSESDAGRRQVALRGRAAKALQELQQVG